jgi:hypothetical protein
VLWLQQFEEHGTGVLPFGLASRQGAACVFIIIMLPIKP